MTEPKISGMRNARIRRLDPGQRVTFYFDAHTETQRREEEGEGVQVLIQEKLHGLLLPILRAKVEVATYRAGETPDVIGAADSFWVPEWAWAVAAVLQTPAYRTAAVLYWVRRQPELVRAIEAALRLHPLNAHSAEDPVWLLLLEAVHAAGGRLSHASGYERERRKLRRQAAAWDRAQ